MEPSHISREGEDSSSFILLDKGHLKAFRLSSPYFTTQGFTFVFASMLLFSLYLLQILLWLLLSRIGCLRASSSSFKSNSPHQFALSHYSDQNPCLRRNIACLSLSSFYRYCFALCSRELAACVPLPLPTSRSTRQVTISHTYCVNVGNSRIGRFNVCFFLSTSRMWSSLPPSIFFPNSFNSLFFTRRI